MKYQLQATVRWQRTVWQIIVLALPLMMASVLATAQNEQQPDTAEEYFKRGAAYALKGESDRAIQDYSKAISLDPKYANAYFGRGTAYLANSELDRAIQDLNQAISLNPKFVEAYLFRGAAYRAIGRNDLADADGKKAKGLSKQEPLTAEEHFIRGNASFNKGDYKRAIKDYSQAVSLSPKYAESYNNRGVAHSVKGKIDLAIQDFDKAISLNPEDAEAYYNRGLAYHKKVTLSKLLVWRPPRELAGTLQKPPDVSVISGREYLDRAIQDYSQAISLDPKLAKAYKTRAEAYRAAGKNDLADADERKAQELSGQKP